MLVYQRSSPGWPFNQAHNHYLQVAAEGGLLAGVPVLLALICLARAALDGASAARQVGHVLDPRRRVLRPRGGGRAERLGDRA